MKRLKKRKSAATRFLMDISILWEIFIGWLIRNIKVFASLLIIMLAIADGYAVYDLFVSARIPGAWIFASVSAVALEGIPIVLSIFLVKWREWKNGTNHKVNDGEFSRIGFCLGLIGFFLLYGVIVFLRVSIQLGLVNNAQPNFVKNVALSVIPLGVAIFAFSISWLIFRTETVAEQEKLVKYLEDDYLKKRGVFLECLYKLQDAREVLWTEVTENKTPMATKLKVFRDEIFKRNKEKIIDDCKVSFPSQLERFNALVESELEVIVRDIETRTSIPVTISELKISDIVDAYESKQPIGAGRWNCSEAKTQLEAELISLINNAIQVAQLKAFVYPIEEDILT